MDNRDLHFVDRYLPELSPLLLELDGAVLDKLSLRRLPPDTLLYQQEDWDESPLYVVVYGVCKLFCNYESLLFPIYCPRGCVIGTLEALSEDFVLRTANMSSFTEVVLLSIPRRLLQHEVYDQSRGLFFWLVRRTILKYHRSGLKYFVRGDVILKLCGYFCDVFAMCRTSTCGEVHSILIRDTQTPPCQQHRRQRALGGALGQPHERAGPDQHAAGRLFDGRRTLPENAGLYAAAGLLTPAAALFCRGGPRPFPGAEPVLPKTKCSAQGAPPGEQHPP